ncbi:MAG: hypothetical protein AMXMBFR61_03120 [Fimbriimonadales bacterium]
MKTLNELLNAYTIKVTPLPASDGGGFEAIYEELASTAAGYGETPAAAVDALRELAENGLSDEPLDSMPAPRTHAPWASYSGRVTLRLPKTLHARLDRLADEQGVSLNQLMVQALQSAADALTAGLDFGPVLPATSPSIIGEMREVRAAMDEVASSSLVVIPAVDFEPQYRRTGKRHGLKFERIGGDDGGYGRIEPSIC